MVERRALVVGINHYNLPGHDLEGAVADGQAIAELLAVHEDGGPNYECRVFLDGTDDGKPITRGVLREAITGLFSDFSGDVLLYFSGHGASTPTGEYLVTADACENDWGMPMEGVMDLARK